MRELVFYTIASIFQIPISTLLAYLFIANRETPDDEHWHFWQYFNFSSIFIFIPYYVFAFDFLFEINNSMPAASFTVVPALVTLFCILGVIGSYYVLVYKMRHRELGYRDTCKAAFYCMIFYAIAIAAYTWWIFNR